MIIIIAVTFFKVDWLNCKHLNKCEKRQSYFLYKYLVTSRGIIIYRMQVTVIVQTRDTNLHLYLL